MSSARDSSTTGGYDVVGPWVTVLTPTMEALMHSSALGRMETCIHRYMRQDRHYDLLDFGSFVNRGQTLDHRILLQNYDCTITGVDIQAGRNVDIQMTRPYRIPVPSNSQDIVISGQVFEHIPFPWASFLEIARVLKSGGYFFITVPSRGHRHGTYDLWRYYADSMRAFAAFADLELVEAHTSWPPAKEGKRHDLANVDTEDDYWGDTTGVFRKPRWKFSPARVIHREIVLRRANHTTELPVPTRKKRRQRRRRAAADADQ